MDTSYPWKERQFRIRFVDGWPPLGLDLSFRGVIRASSPSVLLDLSSSHFDSPNTFLSWCVKGLPNLDWLKIIWCLSPIIKNRIPIRLPCLGTNITLGFPSHLNEISWYSRISVSISLVWLDLPERRPRMTNALWRGKESFQRSKSLMWERDLDFPSSRTTGYKNLSTKKLFK
jgi:hypothetical protein